MCDTLGYRTSINSKIAKITSIGYESTVWRVRFNGNVDEIPVRIQRKKAEKWTDGRDWQVTGITVEADIVDDYYGFEIDGNHLFLLGDCTVTHNTAFTLSLARNAAMEFGKGVAFFSLEMSSLQLAQRLVSMESEVGSSKLRTGQLEPHEWQQLHTSIEKMSKSPIFIDDTPGINVFELRAKCRRLKAQHDIQLIIIDYLQLMTAGTEGGRGGNREQEISAISRALKGLAKELNVPVIALSQLSRAVETRGGSKKPQLSDLRESGAIEQDADIVSFIYRPEYYQIMEDENGNSTKGMATIIVSKHRNGALGEVNLRFVGEFSKFADPDDFGFNNLAKNTQMDANSPQNNIIRLSSRMNDDDIPSAPVQHQNPNQGQGGNGEDIPF